MFQFFLSIILIFYTNLHISLQVSYILFYIYNIIMKKYLLKGKQLLSKKLEEFDIETVNIDYVAEQTPTRLKESLEVLRNNEIDLEDNQQYETYFKNYPNHHISHYLLDKFKNYTKQTVHKQNQLKSQGIPYIPPSNSNSFIPPFDQDLQQKALYFKNSIQQYDQGYTKVTNPLLCICIINFHHKKGTQIQYRYPHQKSLDNISNNIIHHAMPDSSHLRNEDFNLFNFQAEIAGKKRMMFGVSYFKQIKVTAQMKKSNPQLTRSHVQKAVAIISTLPLFQYLKIRVQNIGQILFQDFQNFQIIKQVYLNINHSLIELWPNIHLSDLYMGCDTKKIIKDFGVQNLFDIWKAILYQKRVVIFAQTSSDASSFILSLLSLFPGLSCFGLCSKPISRYLQSLREYSLPLRLFSSTNFLSISFHVQDFWQLAKFSKNKNEGNFLVGTTNKLLKESNQYGIEMLVNLEDFTIEKNKSRRAWEPLTKKQKVFITNLKQSYEALEKNANSNIEETIRSSFHQFLKSSLLQIIQGIQDFQNFTDQCAKYEKTVKKSDGKNPPKLINHSYKLMEDEEQEEVSNSQLDYAPAFPNSTSQIIFPQLLLSKSFAYFRQFHNIHLPQIMGDTSFPSIHINNYEYYLKISKNQFIAYNWLEKKLSYGKGNYSNFDGKQIKFQVNNNNLQIIRQAGKQVAKNIYIGMVKNGKYMKHGLYVDKEEYYEGQFLNGMKHGYGKLTKGSEKYIGNFASNTYEGDGQLIKNGQIYVGSFKEGLRHGFGSIQGENQCSGYWIKGKFIDENEGPMIEILKKRQSQRKKSTCEDKQ